MKTTSALIPLVALGLSGVSLHAATYTWGFDASGNWSDSTAITGWNAGSAYPNAIDDTANLTFNITAARTVTIDVTDARVGTLVINDTGSSGDVHWVLATSDAVNNKLTFDVTTGSASLSFAGSNSNDISAPVVLADDLTITTTNFGKISGEISGAFGITKNGGSQLTFGNNAGGNNTYAGLTTINAGILALNRGNNNIALPGDALIAGGTLTAGNNNGIADSSNITISSGVFSFGSASGTRLDTINSYTMNGGATNVGTGGTNASALTVTGLTSLTAGSWTVSGQDPNWSTGSMTISGGAKPCPPPSGIEPLRAKRMKPSGRCRGGKRNR